MPHAKSLLWLSVLLPSCFFASVSKLSPEGKQVEVVRETTRPVNCEILEKINGTSRADDEKTAREGAENDFRNKAADLKANFALIEVERSQKVGTTSTREVFIGGKALFCRTLEMEAAEEKKREQAQAEKEEKERKAQEEKERKEQEEKDKKAVEEERAKDEANRAKEKK